jgi:hypothetical protein
MLALVLTPHQAVGLMLPLLMIMDVTGIRAYWRRWSWTEAWPIMLGSVLGIALAASVFAVTDADAVRLLIGALALGFVGFEVARDRGWRPAAPKGAARLRGAFWGATGGFTSFASNAGGPPVAIHLLARMHDKTTYQATTVLIFWWINIVKIGPFLSLGLVSRESLAAGLWLAPVAVAGMLLGVGAQAPARASLFPAGAHAAGDHRLQAAVGWGARAARLSGAPAARDPNQAISSAIPRDSASSRIRFCSFSNARTSIWRTRSRLTS